MFNYYINIEQPLVIIKTLALAPHLFPLLLRTTEYHFQSFISCHWPVYHDPRYYHHYSCHPSGIRGNTE